jgi:hypothetical protein
MIFNSNFEDVPLSSKSLDHNPDFRKNIYYPLKAVPDPTAFFFRLNNKTIFYTSFEMDVDILGAIQINDINYIELRDHYCFNVESKYDQWLLCPPNEEEDIETFYCLMRELKGQLCIESDKKEQIIQVKREV